MGGHCPLSSCVTRSQDPCPPRRAQERCSFTWSKPRSHRWQHVPLAASGICFQEPRRGARVLRGPQHPPRKDRRAGDSSGSLVIEETGIDPLSGFFRFPRSWGPQAGLLEVLGSPSGAPRGPEAQGPLSRAPRGPGSLRPRSGTPGGGGGGARAGARREHQHRISLDPAT